MDRETVIQKVEKLFLLAGNNPNEAEAQSALLKARELMYQYQIAEKDLTGGKQIEIVEMYGVKCNTPWRSTLAAMIARNFGVLSFKRGCGRNYIAVFFGIKEKVEVAVTVYNRAEGWLDRTSDRYATEQRVKYGNGGGGIRQAYQIGWLKGLNAQYDEQSKGFELVLAVEDEVQEAFDEIEIRQSPKARMEYRSDAEAISAGFNDGYTYGRGVVAPGLPSGRN